MWPVLVSALMLAGADSDVQTYRMALPEGKSLAIEATIADVRIEGWDRTELEITIERRGPSAQLLTRLPVAIDDTPARVTVRAIQADGLTDPEYRSNIVVRLPRAAVIDHVQVLEGGIAVARFSGTLAADIRRGSIAGTNLSGVLRLESGIGSVVLTGARLTTNGLLRLRAFNGDVRLTLAERPADARIMALALNGHITSDIALTMKDRWGPRWGEASIGKGEPLIAIDVVTGSIEIKAP